jgi:hypothetical protein
MAGMLGRNGGQGKLKTPFHQLMKERAWKYT